MSKGSCRPLYPRGSIYTTITELGPPPPNRYEDGLLGPCNSIMAVSLHGFTSFLLLGFSSGTAATVPRKEKEVPHTVTHQAKHIYKHTNGENSPRYCIVARAVAAIT